jgi:hypothetical protein
MPRERKTFLKPEHRHLAAEGRLGFLVVEPNIAARHHEKRPLARSKRQRFDNLP